MSVDQVVNTAEFAPVNIIYFVYSSASIGILMIMAKNFKHDVWDMFQKHPTMKVGSSQYDSSV